MQCDCCGSGDMAKFAPYCEYQHYKCKGCGFEKFVNYGPVVAADLYENDADYIDDLNVVTSPEELLLWHHLEAIKFLQSKFQGRDIATLDIGCFNGFFVKKLLSLGYDAHGVDFNKNAVAYGKENLELGSRISTQSIEAMIEQEKRFDVITLFEVLEHLSDMKIFLKNAEKLLKNKGIIILSTPNNKMCWRPALDFPPHHLSRFTTESLEKCLSKLEMDTLYRAEQMSIYELTRHYMGTFFRAKNSTSLRGGEFKNKRMTTILRRAMNKMRRTFGVLLLPIDGILYFLGVRYISQIVVAEKKNAGK